MKEGVEFTLSVLSHIEQIAPYDMEFKRKYLMYVEDRAPQYIVYLHKLVTQVQPQVKGNGYDIFFAKVSADELLKYVEENYDVE